MPSAAATLRVQIESALAHKIPAALTPAARTVRPVTPSGISDVDTLLNGGIPIGAITEIAGPACSGRTTLALSILAQITGEAKVAAWIDVSDALHPESAAASGIDLKRLLWVRCGAAFVRTHRVVDNRFTLTKSYFTAPPPKKGLHGGGFGPHPRTEEKGLSTAVDGLLASAAPAADLPAHQQAQSGPRELPLVEPVHPEHHAKPTTRGPVARMDQALRVTDLLLQAGGFGAIVIDLAGIAPEHVTRIPAATWFRYRAAAEKTRVSILLLTQHACAQSSAALVLRTDSAELNGTPDQQTAVESTVFNGLRHSVEVARQRFAPTTPHTPPARKPPQNALGPEMDARSTGTHSRRADWNTRPTWIPQPGPR